MANLIEWGGLPTWGLPGRGTKLGHFRKNRPFRQPRRPERSEGSGALGALPTRSFAVLSAWGTAAAYEGSGSPRSYGSRSFAALRMQIGRATCRERSMALEMME